MRREEVQRDLTAGCACRQGAQEWCSLLILRVGDEVLLVLLPGDSPATQPVAGSCIAVAALLMKGLSSSVAQHLQAIRRQHIPTFRCRTHNVAVKWSFPLVA